LKTNINIETELNDLDLIAIGTAEGTILLFSLSKAALHSQLVDESGHTDKVNDIAWCSLFNDKLYSCSDDGYIIEWSFVDSKLKK
jgi:U3 small nucleolar RNA-associated protein 5